MFTRSKKQDLDCSGIKSEISIEECFIHIQNKNINKIVEYFDSPSIKLWQLKDNNGYTILHKSVFLNLNEITILIIDKLKKRLAITASSIFIKFLNQKTNEGLTALHYAAYKGNINIAKLLIENGASVNVLTNLSKNLLHMAAEGNQPSMMVYLIYNHAQDIFSGDENGSTPLHWACYSGATESVNLLISLNARINAQDKEKLTPLHLAALYNRVEIIIKLLQNGGNKNAENSRGERPIDIARKRNFTKIVKLLEDKDYNPLFTLETPIDYIEPNNIYKKIIFLMLVLPEIIIFILVLPFLEGNLSNIINFISFFLCFFSYLVFIYKNPGYKINQELSKTSRKNAFHVLIEKNIDFRYYCPTCFVRKSPFVKHCFICNKCVEQFHHHCFWIDKCIGKNNFYYYLWFICTSLFFSYHSIFICLELLWDGVNLPYEKKFPPVWFEFGMDIGFRVLGGSIVCVFGLVCSFPLSILLLIEIYKKINLIQGEKKKNQGGGENRLKEKNKKDNDNKGKCWVKELEMENKKEKLLEKKTKNKNKKENNLLNNNSGFDFGINSLSDITYEKEIIKSFDSGAVVPPPDTPFSTDTNLFEELDK